MGLSDFFPATSALLVGTLLCSTVVVGGLSPAWAQPTNPSKTDEAVVRYKQGVKLFEEQDFNAALLEFRKAYELAPNYKVAYNIGQVYYQVQNYAKALQWFERYLSEGAKDILPERRAEVQKEIDELRRRVGRVELQSEIQGVDISIDDEPIGKTPLPEPLSISAGRHRITASKEGYAPFSQTVEIAGQEFKRIPIKLIELTTTSTTPSPSTTTPVPPKKEEPSKLTVGSWVGLGAAGLLGAGAVVTGILALGAADDAQNTLYAPPHRADAENKNDRRKTLAITTDVLAGAAILTAGITLVVSFSRSPEEGTAKTNSKLILGASPRGAWLQGQF